ncbi:MAG: hypothetical protein J0H40_17720 [Rhizobiales bacterium]|nr:hypothetical protein [Hyphomicrobiales bacterium]
MGKFGSLAAPLAEVYRVEIIYPKTDKVICDKDGNPAWIDVLPSDGEAGRAFDKEERTASFRRARRSRSGVDESVDQLELNIAKCAALTKDWYLVDPETKEKIDVPCTAENAKELYSSPGMNWLFVQPFTAAHDPANFMKSSAKA